VCVCVCERERERERERESGLCEMCLHACKKSVCTHVKGFCVWCACVIYKYIYICVCVYVFVCICHLSVSVRAHLFVKICSLVCMPGVNKCGCEWCTRA
jgi:hypothetical protein